MRSLLVVVVCLLAAHLVVASDVVDLSDSNFDSLTGTGAWLVEFYAPWCGHCKKLAPIYEEVATKLKGSTNVGKVDCTVYKALQDRFGIRGFPTIKFIKDGKMYDYSDKRELESFVAFVEGNFNKQEGKPVPSSKPKLEITQPAEKVEAASSGSDVVVLTQDTFDAKTATGEWLLEFYAPWCGHCKNLAPTYEAVATALKPRVNVAKIDCTAEEGLRARFNIKGYPTLKFLKEGKLYDYSGGRSGEQLIEFVTTGYSSAVSEGMEKFKADPNVKRGEVKTGTKGTSDVVVLTERNFDDKVADGAWLVEFFAPWCGHCKNLAPTYEKVATALKGNTNVAKVDCTTDKEICSRMGIRGFPTIQLFRGGLKYEYNGDRSVSSFQDFVKNGWESVTGEVPGQKNVWKDKFVEVILAVESVLRVNIYVVIGGCVLAGLMLGVLIVILTAPKDTTSLTGQTTTPTTTAETEDDGHSKKD